jgi:hypothetical protein
VGADAGRSKLILRKDLLQQIMEMSTKDSVTRLEFYKRLCEELAQLIQPENLEYYQILFKNMPADGLKDLIDSAVELNKETKKFIKILEDEMSSIREDICNDIRVN